MGTSFETVRKLCSNSKVLEGFSMQGGVERDGQYLVIKGEKASEAEVKVKEWLQSINVTSER